MTSVDERVRCNVARSSFTNDLLPRLADALLIWTSDGRRHPHTTNADHERSIAAAKDALTTVQHSRNWRSIPSLVNLLAHESAELRSAGASVIDDLAALIPVTALPGFESGIRTLTYQAYSWHELQIDQVVKHDWPPRVWAIFSMHRSGHVREAATRQLASQSDSTFALPYLLLRVNDWVKQVRTVATTAVMNLLTSEQAAAWVPVLGLVDELRHRSRADHAWLTIAVTSLLLRPESRPELMRAVRSEDRLVARWAFRAAVTLPDSDRAVFVALALQSRDSVARLHAARTVRTWTECPRREEFLKNMASDRFLPIRREALYAALEGTPEERRSALRAALLDRSASIRYAARFYLRDQPDRVDESLDIRGLYIDALAHGEPSRLAAAIAGVGECGDRLDADTLVKFVADDRPAVAAAAARAVAALDRDHRIRWFAELLRDHRPSVAREASRALVSIGSAAPIEALRQILRAGLHEHSRRYALRILLRRHRYDAVVDAVTAACSDDAALVRLGTDFIEQARPRNMYYGPSEAQKAAAKSAMEDLQIALPESLRRRVQDFMGLNAS